MTPLEIVDGIGLPQVGLGLGWAVAFLFTVAVLRGGLIPRQTHLDAVRAHEKALEDMAHDRDEWRAESRIKDAQLVEKDDQIGEKDKQLGHLAEVGRNVLAILGALRTNAEGAS